MSSLTFSDGMTFRTDGRLRVTHKRDGWYVVGEGMLIPVCTYEEGKEFIREMEAEKQGSKK